MKSIRLSDMTLKLAGNQLSFREKIEIAKLLDKVNVSVIELNPIANRKIDSLLIKSIVNAVGHSTVAVPVGMDPEGVDLTWAALKDAKHARLQVVAPMSSAQMEYFWHKKPPKMLDAIRMLVTRSRELCPEVEFVADDACRSEKEFLCDAVRTAIEAGAAVVTLCDSAGLMLPEEFASFMKEILEAVPAMKDVRVGVKCSDALSLAGACAISAAMAGADEIKTVSCDGDAAKLSEFAAIIKNRGDAFGLSCDIRQTEIRRITSQVERMVSSTGSKNGAFESGASDSAETEGMVLSAQDDCAAVLKAVARLGYDLSEEDGAKVYEAFMSVASRKSTVTAKELDSIVASAAMQVPATYKLDSFVINCGNIISATAHMKLDKNGELQQGICIGDGPIDAAFRAIEQIAGHHFELDDFQIRAVTEGHEAMGESVVRLRSEGKLYSGRGISTDVIGAAIRAYINALNKIVYEEAEA